MLNIFRDTYSCRSCDTGLGSGGGKKGKVFSLTPDVQVVRCWTLPIPQAQKSHWSDLHIYGKINLKVSKSNWKCLTRTVYHIPIKIFFPDI